MVPESVAALYAFLGLITPGLVYQLLRERSRPALDESSFREASRVALTSAVLTTLSLLSVAGIGHFQPAWFVDAREWLRSGQPYVNDNPGLVTWTVVAVVALACFYALLTDWLWTYVIPPRRPRISKTDVWYQLFRGDVPKGQIAWVHLKLTDGTLLWGHLNFVTLNKATDDTQIVLRGPQLTVQVAGSSAPKPETTWQRVAVRASDVFVVKVTYVPKANLPR
jgi:hypothetical protein